MDEFMSMAWPEEFGGRSRSRSPGRGCSPSSPTTPPMPSTPEGVSDGIFVIPMKDDGKGSPPMPSPPEGATAIAASPPSQARPPSKPPIGAPFARPPQAPIGAPIPRVPPQVLSGPKQPAHPPPHLMLSSKSASAPPAKPKMAPPTPPSDEGERATTDPYGGGLPGDDDGAGGLDRGAASPADLQRVKAELLAFTRDMSPKDLEQWWNHNDNIEAETFWAVRHNVSWRDRGPPPPGEGGPKSWKGATWRPVAKRWASRGGGGTGAGRTSRSSSSGDLGRFAAFWSRWYGEGIQALR